MSATVDVLAVMDSAKVRCGPELAAAMVEARAAVAELIAAAVDLQTEHASFYGVKVWESDDDEVQARMDRALDGCGVAFAGVWP